VGKRVILMKPTPPPPPPPWGLGSVLRVLWYDTGVSQYLYDEGSGRDEAVMGTTGTVLCNTMKG